MSRFPLFAALCVLSPLAACGGSDYSDQAGGVGGGSGSGAIDPSLVSDDPIGTNAACVSALKSASLPAVNLVMMIDKSGSMGNPAEGGDPTVKWMPVNAGLKSFFADPASASYNASLQFFPAPGDLATTCAAPYEKPLVPLTSLASSTPLVKALEAASPTGGTPTLPALHGALTFAQKTAAARPFEKTVVVLVTDGEPGLMVNGTFAPGCANNDVPHVAAVAASAFQASPSVPTYVIGVGPSLSKLEAIAQAGGTKQAFMIAVSSPADTSAQLRQALESIRAQVKVSCDFSLPEPPQGQRLDPKRVNVALDASGAVTPLVYSKDCSNPRGWRYDDLEAPTRMMLCDSSCNAAQESAQNKITVAFGCATNGVPR